MKVRSVYLAGPLDRVSHEVEWYRWRETASLLLAGAGITAYDPQGAFPGAVTHPQLVPAVNNQAVRSCDALLAVVEPDVPSWGTPMEIALAESLGKPIALWTPNKDKGVPFNLDHLPRFDSLYAAVDCLAFKEIEVDDGGLFFEHVSTGVRSPVYPGDVGYDLYAAVGVVVGPGETVKLALGDGKNPLKVACPEGVWFTMFPRSSAVDRGLRVVGTVVDTGYRGPLFAYLENRGNTPQSVVAGEKIAQMVFFGSVTPKMLQVDKLKPSLRGENGFGSSGR